MLKSDERERDVKRRIYDRTWDRHRGCRTRALLGAVTVIICMTVFALHSWALPLKGWAFGNAHLHDFMAMPILLGWIDVIASRQSTAGRLVTSAGFSAALTLLCAAIWEIVVPVLKPSSVGDWLDACAYLAGSSFYIITRTAVLARASNHTNLQGSNS